MMTRARRAYSIILIAGFLAILGIGISGLAKPIKDGSTENRKLAALPALPKTLPQWETWPQDIDGWVRDRFGLRRPLIKLYGKFSRKVSGKSKLERFTKGKQGWVYYTDQDSVTGAHGVAPPELLARWRQDFFARRDWLESQGIKYLFVLAPDKHTIYPEFAPANLSSSHQTTRLDRVLDSLGSEAVSSIVDLREIIRAAKPTNELYYHLDTHWNLYGAYIAYREIARRVQATDFPMWVVPIGAEEFAKVERQGGDLTRGSDRQLLDVEIAPTKPLPCTENIKPVAFPWDSLSPVPSSSAATYQVHCPGRKGRVLVLHDSFSQAMKDYYASAFAETTFVWFQAPLPLLKFMVETIRPELVIEERVERFMNSTYREDARLRKMLTAAGAVK